VALETFNYLDSLVPDNPVVNDGLVNGDDHIRGIKLALKNTFPSITGPVTATQADLNAVAGGASILRSSGAMFNANPTDGFKNVLAGDIDVYLQGALVATWSRAGGINTYGLNGNANFSGTLTVAGAITGPGIAPIGSIVIWPSDTLPPTTEGVWWWCNGAQVSRTTYATLLTRIGTVHGAGDGSTTFNLPNYQEIVPVGKSGMGGAASPGLLASIAAGVKGVLNGLFGSDTTNLSIPQLPAHTHANTLNDPGHFHNLQSSSNAVQATGGIVAPNVNGDDGSVVTHLKTTGITITNASVGAGAAVPLTQPSRAVNFIIRLA
jgi:microcystin-dependent protein